MDIQKRKFIKKTLSGIIATAASPFILDETFLKSAHATEKHENDFEGDYLNNSLEHLPFNSGWRNWLGNIHLHPKHIFEPNSLSELKEIISQSSQVRAIGSGHSFTGCVSTDDTLIKTDKLNKILSIDHDAGHVHVEAGMKLSQFNQELAKLGYALPNMGDVDYQSLAGLIATGTHGSGMKWGTLADESLILGADLVTANGNTLNLASSSIQDQEILKAVRVNLGALGVVYSLTFQVVPAHNIELVSKMMSLDEALDPSNYQNNDHFEFWYLPFTTSCNGIFRNKTLKPIQSHPVQNWFRKVFIENILFEAILEAAQFFPSRIPNIMNELVRILKEEHSIDTSFKSLISPRLFKAYDIEYALPIKNAKAGMNVFIECAESFAKKSKNEGQFFANLPVNVRFTRGDTGSYLSHAHGNTCYIDVASHIAFGKECEPFFVELEKKWIELGGRPHWGKMFYANPRNSYPEFNSFFAIRNTLDPNGKFMNDFMSRLWMGYPF